MGTWREQRSLEENQENLENLENLAMKKRVSAWTLMRSRCFVCPTAPLVQSLGVSTSHAGRRAKKGKRREQRSLENLESLANQASLESLETPVESPANLENQA